MFAQTPDGGWWKGASKGETGWFPASHVSLSAPPPVNLSSHPAVKSSMTRILAVFGSSHVHLHSISLLCSHLVEGTITLETGSDLSTESSSDPKSSQTASQPPAHVATPAVSSAQPPVQQTSSQPPSQPSPPTQTQPVSSKPVSSWTVDEVCFLIQLAFGDP